jgi:class 3 adenylate cyclase/predicted ATPase
MQCANCQKNNPDGARFCIECGTKLPESNQPSERRQLTVLFADLADSTRLAASLDPEDWSEVLQRYQEACASCVQDYDGHIAQYLGDGVLVYFGYPRSHEDSAARSLRCALAIRDSLAELNPSLEKAHDIQLQIRIGIHTGPVVVEQVGANTRRENLALGNTPNVAARLQSLAKKDGIVASQLSLELAGPGFVSEDMGPQSLKGIDEPIQAAQITGLSGATQSSAQQHPFVGRVDELAALDKAWSLTRQGGIAAAIVTGNPGMGKSRIVQAFQAAQSPGSYQWLHVGFSAFDSGTAFSPLKETLSKFLINKQDPAASILQTMSSMSVNDPRMQAILLEFLGEPADPNLPTVGSRIEKRDLTFEGVITLLAGAAAEGPLVLCVEDIHWADPSTMELLEELVNSDTATPIFVLMTSRNDPLDQFADATRIALSRLDGKETAQLMTAILGDDASGSVEDMALRSDGVPLFAEELAKAMAKTPDQHMDDVPATLHDLLRAQLDQLGEIRHTAQAASVLGREFNPALLIALVKTPPFETQQHVDQLMDNEMLVQDGPDQLRFRHALIQEEAYSSMLRRHRRTLHAAAADLMADQFTETPLHVQAHHRSEAAQPDLAVHMWYRAAGEAREHYANHEALAHLETGMADLAKLPENIERNRLEMRYQLSIGHAVSAARSFYDEAAVSAYARARDISATVEDKETLFNTLALLQANSVSREPIEHSRELAEQLVEIAKFVPSEQHKLTAEVLSGMTEYADGNMTLAVAYMEPTVRQMETLDHPERVGAMGSLADAYLGPAYWMAGNPSQATKHVEAALARAHLTANQNWIADVLNCAGQVHILNEDTEPALAAAHALKTLGEEIDHNIHTLNGAYMEAICQCLQGNTSQGLKSLISLNESVYFQGLEAYFSWWQHHIVDHLMRSDRFDAAHDLIIKTLSALDEFGGGPNRPCLLQRQAQILQARGDETSAEAHWKKAIELAHKGQSYGWRDLAMADYGLFLTKQGRAKEVGALQVKMGIEAIYI